MRIACHFNEKLRETQVSKAEYMEEQAAAQGYGGSCYTPLVRPSSIVIRVLHVEILYQVQIDEILSKATFSRLCRVAHHCPVGNAAVATSHTVKCINCTFL